MCSPKSSEGFEGKLVDGGADALVGRAVGAEGTSNREEGPLKAARLGEGRRDWQSKAAQRGIAYDALCPEDAATGLLWA